MGRRAGVSAATVSLALRNDPRIPAATQKKVRAAARALRYRPDPLLAALVARRDQGRPRRVSANLAALIDDRWHGFGPLDWLEKILGGMRDASRRLGYNLEELRLQADLGAVARPDRLLQARGIVGVALLPPVDDAFRLKIDWKNYAAVVIGNAELGQVLNRVGSDAFASAHLICEKLAARGYRRLGLAYPLGLERRLRFERLGALGKEQLLPGSRLHIVPPYLPEEMAEATFLRWVKKERPEAVLTSSEQPVSWLEKAGYRIPRDIGVALFHVDMAGRSHASGVAQHQDVCGETAVEQLHASLLRGERGYPAVPRETLIRSHWVEGTTLKTLKARPKPRPPSV